VLAQRVLAGIVGVPLIFVLILVGGDWYVAAVAAALAVAALEFQHPRFAGTSSLGWLAPMSLLAAAFAAAIAGGAHAGYQWVLWFTAVALVVSLAAVVVRFDAETALTDWSWTMAAVLYAGFLGSFIVLVRDLPDGRDWAFLTLFGTFAIDTAAFFTGRAFGRHKLAPRISPAKTIEGFIGGYAAGFAAIVLLNYFLGLRITGWQIVVLALLLPLFAAAGDLAESALKRAMRIKDASELIPGHGGVMDRLDSLLFAFTLVYLFYQWVVV
jgi:phosphatidate cytidylyltransferase